MPKTKKAPSAFLNYETTNRYKFYENACGGQGRNHLGMDPWSQSFDRQASPG